MTEILKTEIENIIKKYKNLNIDDSINNTDEDTFKNKLNEGYNYPCYPGHKEGKNLLIYVRNYLILKKENIKNNRYPSFINNLKGNIDTEKKYFRTIASTYDIDQNNNLYIKYYFNKDNNINKIQNKKNVRKKMITIN